MRLLYIILIACWASLLSAGTIIGTVTAKGRTTPQDAGGKYDSRKFKFVEVMDYSALREFVVYIDQPTEAKPEKKTVEIVTQKDATFRPHVMPVGVGTSIEWPNNDEIYHNVFSISEPKTFDLGLYKKNEKPQAVTFDTPGRVDVFCSIHKEMHCIVLVLENPYFAPTDSRNRYVITNVPPGTYKLKAWHERVPSQVKQVVVPSNGTVKVDFVLGFSDNK